MSTTTTPMTPADREAMRSYATRQDTWHRDGCSCTPACMVLWLLAALEATEVEVSRLQRELRAAKERRGETLLENLTREGRTS